MDKQETYLELFLQSKHDVIFDRLNSREKDNWGMENLDHLDLQEKINLYNEMKKNIPFGILYNGHIICEKNKKRLTFKFFQCEDKIQHFIIFTLFENNKEIYTQQIIFI